MSQFERAGSERKHGLGLRRVLLESTIGSLQSFQELL